jgi:hypothetical protein
MIQIAYGMSTYKRDRGNLPQARLVNMFVEQSATNKDGAVLQSRQGLVPIATIGTGPIRAILQRDGIFDGDRFSVSGNGFYRNNVLLGNVDGAGVGVIAANDVDVLVTCGMTLYSYNGIDFVAVAFPDGAFVRSVVCTGQQFVAIREGTGEWYFSALNNGRNWDALDQLLDLLTLDGVLVFFGTQSIEFWGATGEASLPYTPIQQRVFEQGIAGTGCATRIGNTFYWIGGDGITYRNGDVPDPISDNGISELAVNSNSFRLYVLEDGQHKFLCQKHDNNTVAFNISTGEWSEFATYGRDNFAAGQGFGDIETNQIYAWSNYNDYGQPLERIFSASVAMQDAQTIHNIRLFCQTGTTEAMQGYLDNPTIELRTSDDAGNEWSDWEPAHLGRQGEYRKCVEWRRLGMFDEPGFMAEFRVTDPVGFRVSMVSLNASSRGRSR